jgi:ABC-type polysaccharide/polyol phosphate transport system ATPase subunit
VTAAIEVEGVSKRFRLYREKPSSIKQRLLSGHLSAEDFWALRDVSFEVPAGSSLGLIGHNGSGKTTLLKCIAGILRPTSGSIRYRGRVAALLELGAGFHPELTGRENVYLNASFLGLTRRQTDAVYDDIVGFAEIADFMDNQVKFFSSGMLVRLGFAVAVHVDPDVLLIDEVLAVGDEAFQAKCIQKVRSFQEEGRTIVLVTHALDTVVAVCDAAVMLEHGVVHTTGTPMDVVAELRHRLLRTDPTFVPEEGTREVEIDAVEVIPGEEPGPKLWPGQELTIQVDVHADRPVRALDVSIAIVAERTNHPVIEARASRQGMLLRDVDGKRRIRFRVPVTTWVGGEYFITVGLESPEGLAYHIQTQRYSFEAVEQERLPVPLDVEASIEVEDL